MEGKQNLGLVGWSPAARSSAGILPALAALCWALAPGCGPAPEPPIRTPAADTKPAPTVPTIAEVEAVVAAVSRPRTPREMGVYIHGFFVVRYEVRKVSAGRLEEKVVQAVHWSVRDRKATPAAAIKVGEVHRLALGPWEAARRTFKADQIAINDDFIDIETPMFLVVSWGPAPK